MSPNMRLWMPVETQSERLLALAAMCFAPPTSWPKQFEKLKGQPAAKVA